MKCIQCGADVPSTAKFCPECGAATSTTCSLCGVAIPTTAKLCLECGASQSPEGDALAIRDTTEPLAQPNGTGAEPDDWRLPSHAEPKEEEPEPKQSSSLVKIALICGALPLAIVLAGSLLLGQRDAGIAHFKRGEDLKNAGDYKGAKQELERCLSDCKGWEKNTAREELERIEQLIAAREKPPQAQQSAESQAISADALPVVENTQAEEKAREETRNTVKSNLVCKSHNPLADGRYLEMDTARDGERLLASFYAVNSSTDLHPLWNLTFLQDDSGVWSSYDDSGGKATLIFAAVDGKISWVETLTAPGKGKAYQGGECQKAH
jgi:ribosomal protein L40E